MTCTRIRHTVEDIDTWKPYFEQHAETREEYGERGYQLYRTSDDPNDVVIVLEWADCDSAERFLHESDLEDVMAEAGVVGDPEVSFLDEIEAKRQPSPSA